MDYDLELDNVVELVRKEKAKLVCVQLPDGLKSRAKEVQDKKWFITLWEMNNVMPGSPLEKDIAAFPEELPYRAIKLFSYVGEIVLDPFVGSGTTMKIARQLGRNSIGIEIKKSLIPVIKKKTGFDGQTTLNKNSDDFKIIERAKGWIK